LVVDQSCCDDELECRLANLVQEGWRVHLVGAGTQPNSGVSATPLECVRPGFLDLGSSLTDAIHRSELLLIAIAEMHRERAFDHVVFAGSPIDAYRVLQAKRAGHLFGSCGVVVPDPENSGVDGKWPSSREELFDDHACEYVLRHRQPSTCRWTKALTPAFLGECSREAERARTALGPTRLPLVTVGVTHYNLGRFLPETLESLAAQTYPNLEVLVIDDGSNDLFSRAVFAEQEKRWPRFRFLRQPNSGVSRARNALIAEARGEFFCTFDGDDLANADMVERLVGALVRHSDCAGISTYQIGFVDDPDVSQRRFTIAFRPLGGPHLASALGFNVFGGTMAIFRTAALRDIGGYDSHPENVEEDWHLYVKLANRGYLLDVLPDYVAQYRIRPDSRHCTFDRSLSRRHILREMAHSANFASDEMARLLSAIAGIPQIVRHVPQPQPLRHRVVDRVNDMIKGLPGVHTTLKSTILAFRAVGAKLRGEGRPRA
jgi:GT2 family glycosyltransferase